MSRSVPVVVLVQKEKDTCGCPWSKTKLACARRRARSADACGKQTCDRGGGLAEFDSSIVDLVLSKSKSKSLSKSKRTGIGMFGSDFDTDTDTDTDNCSVFGNGVLDHLFEGGLCCRF